MTPTRQPALSLRTRRVIAYLVLLVMLAAGSFALVYGIIVLFHPVDQDVLRDTLPVTVVTVQPGDTWWTLAASCPDMSRPDAVQALADALGVDPNAQLVAGTTAVKCR